MKGILEDIQLLATIKTMTPANVEKVITTVPPAQGDKVAKAIADVTAWPSSVPDEVFQEGTGINNFGGTQNVNAGLGTQNNNTGSGKQFIGERQYFGKEDD